MSLKLALLAKTLSQKAFLPKPKALNGLFGENGAHKFSEYLFSTDHFLGVHIFLILWIQQII